MIDLKETKRLKDQLLAQPENFLQIINDTDLAICITNTDGNFVAVNDNYVKLYGFEKEDLVGQAFTKVVPKENRAALKKYHDRFFVDKYEILRQWVVQNAKGEKMEIFADAGYNDKINNAPHKITLIQFQKVVEADASKSSDYANAKV